MTLLRKICLFYTVALLVAASLNYIPGLTDENGLAFGIFALDPVDEDTADESDNFLFQDNLRTDPSFRPHKAKSTRHEPVHTRSRSRSKSNSAEPPPLPAKSRDKSALDNPASVPVHATPDGFKSRPKIQRT